MRARLGALGSVVETDPRSGIRWVLIPPGSVRTMRGKVLSVPRPFLMAETPVTQEQWVAGMSSLGRLARNPSEWKGDMQRPVESVSEDEAEAFSRAVGGRLPTEDEWEYAALGGQPMDPYGPIEQIAWGQENSPAFSTSPVRQKLPNAFGLYDMLGNVKHWTSTAAAAPLRVSRFPWRVTRGRGFTGWLESTRAEARDIVPPSLRFDDVGFRPVKDVPSTYGKTRIELLELDETGELPRTPVDSARIRMIELDGWKRRR